MDFIQALREADAVGIPRQQFLIVWENETRLKQTENELRLQQMKAEIGNSQSYEDSSSVINRIETQLQNFITHQQQVLSSLKEELQQQNRAFIADISILLEGFASQVGRVVKREIKTALEDLNCCANLINTHNNPKQSYTLPNATIDEGLNGTWSKVNVASENSESISSTGAQANFESPIHETSDSFVWNEDGQVIQLQQQENVKVKQESDNGISKHQTSYQQDSQKPRTFSSLFNPPTNTKQKDATVSSIGNFFPPNGSAHMIVYDMSKIALTKKITLSPVYNLQDCPCKIQLSFWSTSQLKIRMCLTFWNLSPQLNQMQPVLTISGGIYNWKSLKYTSLFDLQTPQLDLKTQEPQKIELPLTLNTSRGSHPNVTLEMLFKRGYVSTDMRDCVSINWTVRSKHFKA